MGSRASAPGITPARTYQTSVDVIWNGTTLLGATTPVPQNLSFYVNVTWGAISNANTHVWVGVQDLVSGKFLANISLNGTITAANVLTQNNNGVLIQNYTFATALNKATLGCSTASCAGTIPSSNDEFEITANVWENGASAGGGTAFGQNEQFTALVVTYVGGLFTAPGPYSFNSVPVALTWTTYTSWGYTSNASTQAWVVVYGYFNDTPVWTYSLNNTVNTTSKATGFSSSLVFNGTTAGVWWSIATWTIVLNATTLGCSTPSCNETFPAQADGLQGVPFFAILYTNENGSAAGGNAVATGTQQSGEQPGFTLGSTIISVGVFDQLPSNPQGLPYTQTGWINATWVNPKLSGANATFTGFFQVWDTTTGATTPFATISLNNSVNTVTAGGTSLIPTKNGNGTTPMGIPYVNLTWSITLSATAGSLGTNVPYDDFQVVANVTANGKGYGGVYQWTGGDIFPSPVVLAQYPTTVAVAVSPGIPAYVPLGLVQTFSIAVTNAPITATNTLITVNIIDETLTAETASFGLGPVYVSTSYLTGVANTVNYSFPINSVAMTCSDPICVFWASEGLSPSPTDVYAINITASVAGAGAPTNGTDAMGYFQQSFYAIFTPLSANLAAPIPGVIITPGNVTVSVAFAGSFISAVVLDIYSPTGALVFSQSFSVSGGNATWVVTSPGTYLAVVLVTTNYINPVTNSTQTPFYANLTVTHVPRIYVNSTQYSNSTLIPGLSAAGAGTLLLVLGLVVGMIVALLLGRAVWGGKKEQQPPQQWESGQGQTGGTGGTSGGSGDMSSGSTTPPPSEGGTGGSGGT